MKLNPFLTLFLCHWFGKFAKPTYPVIFLLTIFFISVAAAATALGSRDDTVCACAFSGPMGLLRSTTGLAPLAPLGDAAPALLALEAEVTDALPAPLTAVGVEERLGVRPPGESTGEAAVEAGLWEEVKLSVSHCVSRVGMCEGEVRLWFREVVLEVEDKCVDRLGEMPGGGGDEGGR